MTLFEAVLTRRPSIGVWLGLLAITLHAFGPLLAPALSRAASEPVSHAHDHAASTHQHGAPDTAAERPPAAPELVCVGDCPCCSLGDRAPPAPAAPAVVLLPADATAVWRPAAPTASRVFYPGAHFPPRAPPVFA